MAGGRAQRLLAWRGAGAALLTAEVARARYFVRVDAHEVVAWAEVPEADGRHRIDIGSFASVGKAQAACEQDAERRCRR